MTGVLVAILLLASLLLVHFSLRSQPMPDRRPLDVDGRLPLPEAGQASTVFSLTALFGAYFGVLLVLGIPALVGIACGTVGSLLIIRDWMRDRCHKSFEDFLMSVFCGEGRNGIAIAVAISAIQFGYATSELLILREISRTVFGMQSDLATLAALGIALIGYFYVLFGGYMAVFRTDVLQFVMIAAMVLAFSAYALGSGQTAMLADSMTPRAGYWEIPLIEHVQAPWVYFYHFSIGTILGLGFLLAAPDAWKRVFVVMAFERSSNLRFVVLVGVGFMPFFVLLPVLLNMNPIADGLVDSSQLFAGFAATDALFFAAAVGLISCFLSSFDSALLASVHTGLVLKRKLQCVDSEISRFHWLMVSALIAIFFLFQTLIFVENPYLLANLLMGPFAIVAGIMASTRAQPDRLPENTVLWMTVLGFAVWFAYVTSTVGFPKVPTTYQINTVPGAVLIFFIIVLTSRTLMWNDRKND